MKAPRWVQDELKCIDSRYFAVWDNRKRCMRIRKWHSTNPIDQRLNTWEYRSDNVANLPAYEEVNGAFIESMKEGLYWARNAKYLLQEIDESNARLEQQEQDEQTYMAKFMAKEIYRIYREPRVVLGGKEWQR